MIVVVVSIGWWRLEFDGDEWVVGWMKPLHGSDDF